MCVGSRVVQVVLYCIVVTARSRSLSRLCSCSHCVFRCLLSCSRLPLVFLSSPLVSSCCCCFGRWKDLQASGVPHNREHRRRLPVCCHARRGGQRPEHGAGSPGRGVGGSAGLCHREFRSLFFCTEKRLKTLYPCVYIMCILDT